MVKLFYFDFFFKIDIGIETPYFNKHTQMGIPLYFKTISKKFPETIISEFEQVLGKTDKYGNRVKNHLFFDLNCAIHPCCQNILKSHNDKKVKDNILEKRMLTEIIE